MSTPTKNRRNFWLAIFIIGLPFLWFVPGAIYMRNVTQAQNVGCESTMKAFGAAMLAYVRDNNGQLPDAKKWVSEMRAYHHTEFYCFADSDKTHPVSYAMNANLSGKKLSEIKNSHNVILLYETISKATTPFGRGEDLVRVGKDNVGVGRHHTIGYRFNFYLMADGTVRQPKNMDEVKTYKWTP
jgi:hypothetical protein